MGHISKLESDLGIHQDSQKDPIVVAQLVQGQVQTDTSTRVLQGHANEDDLLLLEASGCQVKVHKRLMPRQYLCQLDGELVDFRM